jgi:hypothetical protein
LRAVGLIVLPPLMSGVAVAAQAASVAVELCRTPIQ